MGSHVRPSKSYASQQRTGTVRSYEPLENEGDLSAGVLNQIECIRMKHRTDGFLIDLQNDIATMYVTIGWTASANLQ